MNVLKRIYNKIANMKEKRIFGASDELEELRKNRILVEKQERELEMEVHITGVYGEILNSWRNNEYKKVRLLLSRGAFVELIKNHSSYMEVGYINLGFTKIPTSIDQTLTENKWVFSVDSQ